MAGALVLFRSGEFLYVLLFCGKMFKRMKIYNYTECFIQKRIETKLILI